MLNSEIGIVTTIRLINKDIIIRVLAGDFLSQQLQSGSGAQTYPYSIIPSRLSSGITRLDREASQFPRIQFGVAKYSHPHITSYSAQE
jgi:hypothetical protein